MSRWRRRLLSMVVLISLFLLLAYFFSSLFLPASVRPRPVRVEIPLSATASSIADLLAEKGVIRSRHAFVLSARLLGLAGQMKAGDYEIDAHHGLFEIIEQLERGDAIATLVTIPEGLTLAQVADLLERRRMASARTFLDLCHGSADRFYAVHVPRDNLEGYLLPDTYKFKVGVGEEEILRALAGNFRKRVLHDLDGAIRASGRTIDEIVIIASLIEREAAVPEDREKISAVIRNRLRKAMPLQIDATVLYALGRHQQKVSFDDLKIDHPYNTYRHHGLPPGPICNPGIASIQAALNPVRENWLYYVAKADRSHHFSDTYDEHRRNGGT